MGQRRTRRRNRYGYLRGVMVAADRRMLAMHFPHKDNKRKDIYARLLTLPSVAHFGGEKCMFVHDDLPFHSHTGEQGCRNEESSKAQAPGHTIQKSASGTSELAPFPLLCCKDASLARARAYTMRLHHVESSTHSSSCPCAPCPLSFFVSCVLSVKARHESLCFIAERSI